MFHLKHFGNSLPLAVAALLLSRVALAELVTINYVTCADVSWSIELDQVDYDTAYYAQLLVVNGKCGYSSSPLSLSDLLGSLQMATVTTSRMGL